MGDTMKFLRSPTLVRVVFGVIWAIDACFKWLHSFQNGGFMDSIMMGMQGQPSWLDWWFNFWMNLFATNPHFFAALTAIIESVVALSLLLGVARKPVYIGGAVFALLVWCIAEGFGGPYASDSTDIGAAIMYVLVFKALYEWERARPSKWSLDSYLSQRISWWARFASPKSE